MQTAGKSLVIRGFPRSLTTMTYGVVCHSLASTLQPGPETLRRIPDHPIAGEVLNQDRRLIPLHPRGAESEQAYRDYSKILDDCRGGRVIKDVLQPFVVDRYLAENPDAYISIRIVRSLADIIVAQRPRQWFPYRSAMQRYLGAENVELSIENYAIGALVWELLAFHQVSATMEYDALVFDESYVFDVLERIGLQPQRLRWHTPWFCQYRDQVVGRRRGSEWRRADDAVRRLRSVIQERLAEVIESKRCKPQAVRS